MFYSYKTMSSFMEKMVNKFETMKDNIPSIIENEYYSKNLPTISLYDYCIRLKRYSKCLNESFIIAYYYLLKIKETTDMIINNHNLFRLLLVSLLLAIKYLEDIHINNDFYAKISGISLQELNLLEVSFIKLLNFNLNIPMDHFMETEYFILN